MHAALLICSDEDCAELHCARGPLEELLALACACGCCLDVVELSWVGRAGASTRGFELEPLS